MDLWRVLPVRPSLRSAFGLICRRELEDPRPVIASLLGSNSTKLLPPHILALYLHNGIKVYASWLAALSANWEEAHLAQIVSVTAALEERLASCASSANVELQERAAELGQLLELVRKGLDAPRPVAPADENTADGFGSGATDPYEESRGFAAPEGSAGPALPPASLLLLSPAFTSHELNPVNSKAQGMVTLPAGLDLDMAIVARSRRDEPASEDEQVDDFGRPRGKGKAVAVDEGNEPRKKKGTKKAKGSRRNQVEDEAEMAKVWHDPALVMTMLTWPSCKQSDSSDSATTRTMSARRVHRRPPTRTLTRSRSWHSRWTRCRSPDDGRQRRHRCTSTSTGRCPTGSTTHQHRHRPSWSRHRRSRSWSSSDRRARALSSRSSRRSARIRPRRRRVTRCNAGCFVPQRPWREARVRIREDGDREFGSRTEANLTSNSLADAPEPVCTVM